MTLAGRELSPAVYRGAVLNLSRCVSVLGKGKIFIIQAHMSAVMVKIIQYSLKKPQTLSTDRRTPDLSLGFKQNPLLKRDKLYSGLTQIFFLHILPSQHLILWEVKNSGKCVVGWKTKGLGIQWRVGEGYPTALAPQGREEPCMEQGCPPCISHSHPTGTEMPETLLLLLLLSPSQSLF